MSARDNTLLAKLGFSDPDRKDSLHDIACRYLATEGAAAVLDLVLGPVPEGYTHTIDAGTEQPITKGVGVYMTTIGFIDAAVRRTATHPTRYEIQDAVYFEVKAGRTAVSDTIRQIRLYRTHKPGIWAFVAPWDLTAEETEQLRQVDIPFVRLGRRFEEYVNRCRTTDPVESRLVL
jgi:hypothetical protein